MASTVQYLLVIIIGLARYSLAQTAGFQTTPGPPPGSTATTPGPCLGTWSIYENTNTPNGIPNSATSVSDCKAACLKYNGCTGIDFDENIAVPVGQRCFFSGSWIFGRNNGTASGVRHYDLIATNVCPGSSASTTIVSVYSIISLLLLIAAMRA